MKIATILRVSSVQVGLLVVGSSLMGCGSTGETVDTSEQFVTNGNWKPKDSGFPGASAFNYMIGDSGGAGPLPVCRATTNGGKHPGKFYNGTCRVQYGNGAIQTGVFDILVDDGFWWKPMPYQAGMGTNFVVGGTVGSGAGSTDPNQVMGICEALVAGTWHIGKFWTPNGFFPRCQYEISNGNGYTEQNGNVGNTIRLLVK